MVDPAREIRPRRAPQREVPLEEILLYVCVFVCVCVFGRDDRKGGWAVGGVCGASRCFSQSTIPLINGVLCHIPIPFPFPSIQPTNVPRAARRSTGRKGPSAAPGYPVLIIVVVHGMLFLGGNVI